MTRLDTLVAAMDEFFRIEACGPDPTFSRRIPELYEPLGVDWQRRFEPGFVRLFNGLMIRGADEVQTVFCSVFPAPEVLGAFLERGRAGDLLVLHHPADIECGDPLGDLGRGFVPIGPEHLDRLVAQRQSVYACHAPLDLHPEVGTTAAMVKAIGGRVEDVFWPYGGGHAGAICGVDPISTRDLMALARYVFGITFVDVAGRLHNHVTRVAVVAGAGYQVEAMREAEAKGAQVYLSGEILNRIDDDRGRRNFREVQDFARGTSMSLVGVSHAASEFLALKTLMAPWLRAVAEVETDLIPMSRWWR
ncbi:MAG: Nif3-like dinuclear metal center hexameric protein [Armatimonadota bacterium]|nr:Nif3-like dinuclear metal center hexameric protein [Armatimonadota bacterium]